MKIAELVRENVQRMQAYSSARDESNAAPIQLDANENPYGNGLNRYPDPYQLELKDTIAEYWGLPANKLIVGNGSDELIDLLIRAFCEPRIDNVIGLKPSYGMYSVCCAINDVEYRQVALDADFSLNAERLLGSIDSKTKIIFICSPNNPTGNSIASKELVKVMDAFQGIVVVDEAYIDFSDKDSWSNRLDEFPQLVVLQTLSKAFSMASLRIGLGWCNQEIVEVLNKIKPPYNINLLSQLKAVEELGNSEKIETDIGKIKRSRDLMIQKLGKLSCVESVYPSDANFILVKVLDADNLYGYLSERGIVVRNRSNEFNCENCLRISIGTEDENKKLLNELTVYQDEKSIVYR